MDSAARRKIIDAHLHLYDHQENRYDFLEHPDEMLEALIGDFSALPRRYLLDHYLADEPDLDVTDWSGTSCPQLIQGAKFSGPANGGEAADSNGYRRPGRLPRARSLIAHHITTPLPAWMV